MVSADDAGDVPSEIGSGSLRVLEFWNVNPFSTRKAF